MCRLSNGILNCPCSDTKTFQFHVQTNYGDIGQLTCTPDKVISLRDEATLSTQSLLSWLEMIGSCHMGRYCVVVYNAKPYPGKILSTDGESVKVKCIAILGKTNSTGRV